MWQEDEEKDVSSCWITLSKQKVLEIERGSNRSQLCRKLALAQALDVTYDIQLNEWMNEWISEYAAAYFPFPNSDTKKRKEAQNSVAKNRLEAYNFHCFTMHFNSLNLIRQLMHFYIQ